MSFNKGIAFGSRFSFDYILLINQRWKEYKNILLK